MKTVTVKVVGGGRFSRLKPETARERRGLERQAALAAAESGIDNRPNVKPEDNEWSDE